MKSIELGPQLMLSAEARLVGAPRLDQDATATGVRRGVYVSRTEFAQANYEGKHLIHMRAVAETRSSPVVFSHSSAALLWGIPIVGPELRQVHLRTFGRPRTHSQRGIRWHHDRIRDEDVTQLAGYFVTSLEQTVLDLARSLPFAPAVTVVDHAIRDRVVFPLGADGISRSCSGATKEQLLDRLARLGGARGVRSARACVEFADARAESAGESMSRALMHLQHFPVPILQQKFPRADGGVDISDFDWPEYGVFGEFDGYGKYVREEYTAGLPIEEIVMREKLREDRIRRIRPRAARWEWQHVLSPPAFRARLIESGLRPLS